MTTWYPYTICYRFSIVTEAVSPVVCEILSLKHIGVTTHVTSLIRWRFDSPYTPGARGHLHARECHAVSHLIWIEGPLWHHKNQGGRSDHWQQGRYSMINAQRRLSKWRINLGVGQVQFDLERSVFDGIWWMTTQMKALNVSFAMAGKAFWLVKIRGH